MNTSIDNSRRMASDALDRASAAMRDLRGSMSDSASAAQRHLGEYTHATTRYVGEHPLKSALIAAAVGAAVAGIVMALRRHDSHDL